VNATPLAHANEHARFVLENLYLANSDEFDAVVYACDACRAVEVHRAAPQPEAIGTDPSPTPTTATESCEPPV
jgi:hypothetical protein